MLIQGFLILRVTQLNIILYVVTVVVFGGIVVVLPDTISETKMASGSICKPLNSPWKLVVSSFKIFMTISDEISFL